MYPVFNKIFRADVIRKNNLLFDESLKFAEDTKFVLDYLKRAKGNIEFITKPLYIYKYGTETSSVVRLNGSWSNWAQSYNNLEKFVGENPTIRVKILLRLIKLRWRISWFRAKRQNGKEYK